MGKGKCRGVDIDPGMMDEYVQIESYSNIPDPDTNEDVLTYTMVSEPWAYVKYAAKIRDDEKEILARESAVLKYIVTIRYNDAVTDHKMRLKYDGKYYDIEGIRVLGRKEYLMLYCTVIE